MRIRHATAAVAATALLLAGAAQPAAADPGGPAPSAAAPIASPDPFITVPMRGTPDPNVYDGSGEPPAPAALAAPGADARKVTAHVLNRHGATPELSTVVYSRIDGTLDERFLPDENGVLTAELPPGEYVILTRMLDRPGSGGTGEFVAAYQRITVGDRPLSFTVYGALSTPVGAVTDRPVRTVARQVELGWYAGVGDSGGILVRGGFGEDVRMYATPTLREDPRLRLTQKETLTSPDGAAGEPYTYRLVYREDGRVPYDLVRRVHDRELAAVRTDYGSFGVTSPGEQCTASNRGGDQDGMCAIVPISVPSTRTDYYLADPDVRYIATVAVLDEATGTLIGYGDAERTWTRGAHRLALGGSGLIAPGPGWMSRQGDLLVFQPSFAGADDAYLNYERAVSPLTGTAVVTKDGVEINRIDGDMLWFDTGLPEGDGGRYRLTIDAALSAPWTELGARNTLDWSFDSVSGPADRTAALPFSVVVLDAEGVRDGFAPRAAEQRVTLTYRTQERATPASATSMSFEVSYDDGATWAAVPIERDGNTATAVLRHPAGARFVSVRMSATDDAGSAITHSTVRAYGLR